MSTPYQAIVTRSGGRVTDVLVCDQATADLFAQWDLYPGCEWIDCTNVTPRPAPQWTFARDRDPRFRPPMPGADWTWNDEEDRWDAPPPPPDPDPPAEEDPEDEEPVDPPADPPVDPPADPPAEEPEPTPAPSGD